MILARAINTRSPLSPPLEFPREQTFFLVSVVSVASIVIHSWYTILSNLIINGTSSNALNLKIPHYWLLLQSSKLLIYTDHNNDPFDIIALCLPRFLPIIKKL